MTLSDQPAARVLLDLARTHAGEVGKNLDKETDYYVGIVEEGVS